MTGCGGRGSATLAELGGGEPSTMRTHVENVVKTVDPTTRW